MKLKTLAYTSVLCALTALPSQAAQLDVKITNLTHGSYFTPLLVAAHNKDQHLYRSGEKASFALLKMAEGGDIGDLATAVVGRGGAVKKDPAGGLLAPGKSTTVSMDTGENGYLSIVAMILPSNDGFMGTDTWSIPSDKGTYTFVVPAYDAGTEANNELLKSGGGAPGVLGMPAIPGGQGGVNGTGVSDTSKNDYVHIHPGILGDFDRTGGKSDANSAVHRWLNPVAKVTVTVK